MNIELNQLQMAPATHFENDVLDYNEAFRCTSCEDDKADGIYHDHLTNGNICEKCLTSEDLPFILGMDARQFSMYQNKVRKQSPTQTV